jgi:hypothetical protein
MDEEVVKGLEKVNKFVGFLREIKEILDTHNKVTLRVY